jgi:negative regulator of replication initiation
MGALVMIVAFWMSCLPVWNGDLQAVSHQTSGSAEVVRRLLVEFESAQRSAFDLARKAKTEAERKEADRAMPDRRKFAQRFLLLASETTDEANAVDALVWVVRNGIRTPEGDQAVQRIADQYVRSDRIAAVCRPLGARGPVGESLLRRISEENPSPRVRGRACLALAFARNLRLQQEVRAQGSLPQSRPDAVEARETAIQERKSKTTALAAEIEQLLRRVLDEFPQVLLDEDIASDIAFVTQNLGPAAGEIMKRIAESHPQATTRLEAECGLAIQQMEIASLVAGLRSVASLPPEAKHCAGPGLVAARVFGGESRFNTVDSIALVNQIEQRLRRIADRGKELNDPGLSYFHLIMDAPTLLQYHAGTEMLLRREAEGHPGRRFRAVARRSLAIYLAGIADLSRTIDSDRVYWVERLGGDRVEQIRRLDPDRLMSEASALAEEISKENQEAAKVPDAKIEGLRKQRVPVDAICG